MKATINIENDQEIRAYVKDLIRGQVMSIAREEITDIVRQEILKKLRGADSYYMSNLIADSVKRVTADILYKEHNVDEWNTKWINPIIEKTVNSSIERKNDWSKVIDEIAKDKIKSLIQ